MTRFPYSILGSLPFKYGILSVIFSVMYSISVVTSQEELNARSGEWRGTPEDNRSGPWKESELGEFPRPPVDENFILLVSAKLDQRYKYQLDRQSFAVFSDNTFRYTVIIESKSGPRNVFYEALRCDTREYKIFAYLNTNGQFLGTSNRKWQPLKYADLTVYRQVLMDEYVCPESRVPRNILEVNEDLDNANLQAKRGWKVLKPDEALGRN